MKGRKIKMQKTYYYSFPKKNLWLTVNLLLAAMIAGCAYSCPCIFFFDETAYIIGAVALSILAWIYFYLFKHKMAVVTDDYIQIDHTAPLYWKDIKTAEERDVFCCCKKRKILVLVPKDNIDYKYNFLQKHNGAFTPFSIPLYGVISSQDEEELREVVKKKVGRIKK